jgi:hypothetical protein
VVVIDSADENLGTERQKKLEDAVAEVVEIPAGLAEGTMKRAEVFEAELRRNDGKLWVQPMWAR